MKKKYVLYSFILTTLLLLLLFPKLCIDACTNSLVLWFQVVIPTLFPFILLSFIIINSTIIHTVNRFFSPFISRILGISANAALAIIIGFLGGYPMGAIITNKLYSNGIITKSEAKFLLSFVNNASPMFILGYIGILLSYTPLSSYFPTKKIAFLLLFVVYLSSFLIGLLFKYIYNPKSNNNSFNYSTDLKPLNFKVFDDGIIETAYILIKIGGYMLLFSIPIYLLMNVFPNHPYLLSIIAFVELAIGENILTYIPLTDGLRLCLICALTSFGSLSVMGQTSSVLTHKDLSLKYYVLPKIMATVLSFILMAITYYYFLPFFLR